MAYEFKLPDLGEGLTEGEIARWLVQEGQEVAEDDLLVEIQTDKTTVEILAGGGKVTRIMVGEGDVVPVGTVLVVIGGDGAEPASAGGDQGPGDLIRKIAQELGVDLESIQGMPAGPDHRAGRSRRRRPVRRAPRTCAACAV